MQFVSCFINLCQTRERRNTFPWWPKWNSHIKRCLEIQSPDISNMLRLAAVTNTSTCRNTCHNYAKWKDNYPNTVMETTVKRKILLSFSLPFFWLQVWKTSKAIILIHVGCLTRKSQNYLKKRRRCKFSFTFSISWAGTFKTVTWTCSVLDPWPWSSPLFIPKVMDEIWSKVLALSGGGTNPRSLLESTVPFGVHSLLEDRKSIPQS